MAVVIEIPQGAEVGLPVDPPGGKYLVIPVVYDSRCPPTDKSFGQIKLSRVQPVYSRLIDESVLIVCTVQREILEDRPQRKREYRPETLPQLQVCIIPVETRPVVPDPLLRILVIDAFIPVTKEICRIARSLDIRME